MRSFEQIGKLIKKARMSHPKGYSQSDLSHLLGYKNGQFVSNAERNLCNMPLKMLKKTCEILDIKEPVITEAMISDYKQTINNYLNAKDDFKVKTPKKK